MIFELSGRQRRDLGWNLVIVFTVVAVAAVEGLTAGLGLPLVLAVGLAIPLALAAVLAVWTSGGGVTVLGPEGIVVRRGALPGRAVLWSEVDSIDTYSAHLGTATILNVTTDSGRSFRLPPLQDSYWGRGPDPDFYDKCEQIIDFWESYASAAD
ncbi:hypothetical protein [Kitasatospora sp. MAP5-34]|uniref:hypothetical protein n=1 Tax=Kitasatospora sp. MAP5-34 TaxID=3035102 RepID=UPI0024751E2D|nr:hypothetical protein [Kitasatospora sp. MAP5-34]